MQSVIDIGYVTRGTALHGPLCLLTPLSQGSSQPGFTTRHFRAAFVRPLSWGSIKMLEANDKHAVENR